MTKVAKVLMGMVLGLYLMVVMGISPAIAADTAHGAQVFASSCAACHIGGGNVVNGAKTLKIEALNQYEMASIEAIKIQVTKGKNAMPSFLGRLTEQDIEDVAAYVLAQAEQGW